MKELLRTFKIDAVYGIDKETFYEGESGYSLRNKKIGTTEYVTDPRFKMHCASIMRHDWKKPLVLDEADYRAWTKTIDWKRNGILGHHTQFDGLISSHHFGVHAKAYFCTMSMSRPCMPIKVGQSLDAVDKAFGGTGKVGSEALEAVKGLRVLTKAQLKSLMKYAGTDIERTWFIFHKLREYLPLSELQLIDLTIRMYTRPTLLLDDSALRVVRANNVANKLKLIRECGGNVKTLTSNELFAQELGKLGIEAPKKISIKQSEKAGHDVLVLAMSKQDQDFINLASHEDPKVCALMAARFAVKSNQMESRCDRLISRAPLGPQPVYLNYYGAKTGRWSGGDLSNWQNLSSKRKEGGAELRASIYAPVGYTFLIADLAQIEARMTAWDSGQQDKLNVFRAYDHITGYKKDGSPIRSGPDVYRYTAANIIYNKPIDAVTDAERFIGKTCDLALGFQAGWMRFAKTLRLGLLGPPVAISDNLAKDVHTAWRNGSPFIVANWRNSNNNIKSAFLGQQRVQQGVCVYEGVGGGVGFLHFPGGVGVRYDDLKLDSEGKLSYLSEYYALKKGGARVKRTNLYGGIVLENKAQGLSRRVIADMALELAAFLPSSKLVLTTHDEVVFAVPTRYADRALAAAKRIMSTPPSWAPDLPLAVDAHLSQRYDK